MNRSEGEGGNEGRTFAHFDSRKRKGVFRERAKQTSQIIYVLSLTRSIDLPFHRVTVLAGWLLKLKNVPSSPSSAIMSLMSWRREGSISPSLFLPFCLQGTSSPSLSTSKTAERPSFLPSLPPNGDSCLRPRIVLLFFFSSLMRRLAREGEFPRP